MSDRRYVQVSNPANGQYILIARADGALITQRAVPWDCPLAGPDHARRYLAEAFARDPVLGRGLPLAEA